MSHWNLDALYHPPNHRTLATQGDIRAILYDNEPYLGRPTEVFAYLGVPADAPRPIPGMVLVHGGGGQAFRQWVALWSGRGYAAIAMDLAGCGVDGQRLPNGGPDQGHAKKFGSEWDWGDIWTYHAIAAAIRGHSLLQAQPGVDPDRIGVTGISWGGYLTCILAGVDHRFACAIPVYGCGHLHRNSNQEWMDLLANMTPARRAWWIAHCDPSSYLPHTQCPTCFVTGTNDFAYPLDSLQRSYRDVPGDMDLCVRLRMPHGHEPGWAPSEIHGYTDHHFRDGPALPRLATPIRQGRTVRTTVTHDRPLTSASLLCTLQAGRWQDRYWFRVPAYIEGQTIRGTLPAGVTTYLIVAQDAAGHHGSSPHQEVVDQ